MNSFMCLKQSDSQPGLQHWFSTDIHLCRCNPVCLMPEDSQHAVRLRNLRSLISRKEKIWMLLPFACFTLGLTLYQRVACAILCATRGYICDPKARQPWGLLLEDAGFWSRFLDAKTQGKSGLPTHPLPRGLCADYLTFSSVASLSEDGV